MALNGRVFSRVVEGIGAAAIVLRKQDGRKVPQAFGANPAIPAAKPQGSLPTLKMPTAQGLGAATDAHRRAPGLKVNAFAAGLKHPRWMHVLPNGDVLVAEALPCAGPIRFALRLCDVQPRCSAPPRSATARTASRCCATRMATASPKTRETFLEGLNQPFGMALIGDTFYVGNTDGVVAFPYAPGANPDRRSGQAG